MQVRLGVFLALVITLGLWGAGSASAQSYDATYYVSASGSDANDGLSENSPFATLAKTADAIHAAEENKNYLIYVMTDLTSTAMARYYDRSVTIKSLGATRFTVTRGAGFATAADTARSWYNPAMLEIETGYTNAATPPPFYISMTLENIIFDDAYRHEGTVFGQAPTWNGTGTPPAGWGSGNYVQDAIVTSYARNATIVLDAGAELRNFGGMTAIRAHDLATVKMKSGSLITDIRPNVNTNNRQVSISTTDYYANGEAAISIANANLYMYEGSRITNIANAHSVKFSGTIACYIDGEIANMIGNKGMDTDPPAGGRGVKSAVFFNYSPTIDYNNPENRTPGSGFAVIGPNANIHHNATKSGTVTLSRNANTFVKIYGKVNNNIGGIGTTTVAGLLVPAGTNGGGLYIVAGGTVYLEDGSEIIGNRVSGGAYGGAASVQQNGSRLIMNGGTVSGNRVGTSTTAALAGIVVSKGNANFEMNGGVINNGPNGLRLYESGSDGTTGILTLNAGSVSGVTVDSAVVYANPSRSHLFIAENGVTIDSGYASVNGRNVTPIQAGFKIGNPNTAIYDYLRLHLPQDWTMPSNNSNVIGFWGQKDGRTLFSVPKPTTGTAPAGYDRTFDAYKLAVIPTNSAGGITGTPAEVFFVSTAIDGQNIIVDIPTSTTGAVVALVQPAKAGGDIVIDALPTLLYRLDAADYMLPYTATYEMPSGWRDRLIADGLTTANTEVTFTIHADPKMICDNTASLTVTSDLFEQVGAPVWNAVELKWDIPLELKPGWETATNMASAFTFSCRMEAVNFQDGDFLYLWGVIALVSQGEKYNIQSSLVRTLMHTPMQSVKFDGNGGAVQPADQERTVKLGETLGTLPPDPVRDQYTFEGWNTQANGSGATIIGTTVITGNLMVYAQWKGNPPAPFTAATPIPTLNPVALAMLALLLGGLVLQQRRCRV
ncbi:MAG: InlB B-repeat-containing protein [Burkholderiales bacterium]|nr:InlB B-repeat-containing protein [Burkholderiales bacterium]